MAAESSQQIQTPSQLPEAVLPAELNCRRRLNYLKARLDEVASRQDNSASETVEQVLAKYQQISTLVESFTPSGGGDSEELEPENDHNRLRDIQRRLQDLDQAISQLALSTTPLNIETTCCWSSQFSNDARKRPFLPLEPSYNVPLATTQNLIDRNQPISDLIQAIRHDRSQNLLSLSGIPGSGRTSTVLQLLPTPEIQEMFRAVIWATGKSLRGIEEQYCAIATRISKSTYRFTGTKSKLDFLHSRLSDETQPILFVLDDFSDTITYEELTRLLPRDGRYTVIMIRSSSHTTFAGQNEQGIDLPSLSVETASQLLLDLVEKDGHVLEDIVVSRRIVARLVCHVASVVLAAQYISRMRISLREFEIQFNGTYPLINTDQSMQAISHLAIPTIWRMSLTSWNPVAPISRMDILELLSFCTFIYSGPMDETFGSILINGPHHRTLWANPFLQDGQWNSEMFKAIVEQLKAHGVLDSETSEEGVALFSIHPCVRQWLWYRESPDQLMQQYITAFRCILRFLQHNAGQAELENNKSALRSYVSSLLCNLAKLERMSEHVDTSQVWLQSQHTLITFLRRTEDLPNHGCEVNRTYILERCLEKCQIQFHRGHPMYIDLVDQLAAVYAIRGQYARAESMHEENLEFYGREMSADLAICISRQGRVGEARDAFEKITSYWTDQLIDTEHYLRYVSKYTETFLQSGNIIQASDVRQTLEGVNPHGSSEKVVLARIYLKLSKLYWAHTRRLESIVIHQRGVEIYEEAVGSSDKRYLSAAHDLCHAFAANHYWQPCRDLYEKVVEGYKLVYGLRDSKTIDARHSYAHAQLELGHNEEGLQIFESDWDDSLPGLDRDNQVTKDVFSCLAKHYCDNSKEDQLVNLYIQGASIYREQPEDRSIHYRMSILRDLGRLHCRQHRWDEAIETLYELTFISQPTNSTPEDIVHDIILLANVYKVQREYGQAETMYQRSLVLATRISGLSRQTLLDILFDLETCSETQGEAAKAQTFAQQYILLHAQIQYDPSNATLDLTASESDLSIQLARWSMERSVRNTTEDSGEQGHTIPTLNVYDAAAAAATGSVQSGFDRVFTWLQGDGGPWMIGRRAR